MQKYTIDISKEARTDIKNITKYIKDILIEPIIVRVLYGGRNFENIL